MSCGSIRVPVGLFGLQSSSSLGFNWLRARRMAFKGNARAFPSWGMALITIPCIRAQGL